MSNPIQSHDLYQPGPQDELKLLHARLAQLQLDIKNMTVLARSLKTALGGLNINTGNTQKQIIDIATKAEKLRQQNEKTQIAYQRTKTEIEKTMAAEQRRLAMAIKAEDTLTKAVDQQNERRSASNRRQQAHDQALDQKRIVSAQRAAIVQQRLQAGLQASAQRTQAAITNGNNLNAARVANIRQAGGISQARANAQAAIQAQRLTVAQNQAAGSAHTLTVRQNQAAISALRLEAAQKRAAAGTSTHGGSMRGLIGSIRNLAYAYFSLGAAAQVFQNILKQTKAMDTLNIAFRTTLGSMQASAQAQEYLLDISERFGANLLGASQAYLKFSAASTQAGVSAEQTQDIFTSVTKASSILGLGAERTSYVFLALEQIMSKGRLSTEELRRQLGEHLPGAFGIAAEAMGVTTAKLTDMLKKGEIASTDFLPKFAKQLEKAYGITQVERIDNLAAAQERFNNQLTLLIKELDLSGAFKDFFNSLADGVKFVIQNVDAFLKLGKAVVQLAVAWTAYKAILIANKALTTFFLVSSLQQLTLTKALEAAQLRLSLAIRAVNLAWKANPIGFVIAAVSALVIGLDYLIDKYDGVKKAQQAIGEATAKGSASMAGQQFQLDQLSGAYAENQKKLSELEEGTKEYNEIARQQKTILGQLSAAGVVVKDANNDQIISQDEVTAAIERYLVSAKKKAQVDALLSQISELSSQQAILDLELSKPNLANKGSGFGVLSDQIFGTQLTSVGKKKRRDEIAKEIAEIEKFIKGIGDPFDIIGGATADPVTPTGDGDKDKADDAFKKYIDLWKKRVALMEDGYEKELELLRIAREEELHIFKGSAKDIEAVETAHLRRVEELNKQYVIMRWKIHQEAMQEGMTKDIEALQIWFEEQKDIYTKAGLSIVGLEQEKRDKLTDIYNKYIDIDDELKQKQFEKDRELADKRFELAQKTFIAEAEASGASEESLSQLRLLQEIQFLKKRREEHNRHIRYMTDDELKENESLIAQKERQFRVAEGDIAIEALKYTQKIERETFNAQKKTGAEKREFKRQQLLELYELELRLSQNLTKEQRSALQDAIAELKGFSGDTGEETDIFSLLNINFDNDTQKQAVVDALDFAKSQLTDFLDFQKEIIDQEIENADRKVQAAEDNLQRQIALATAGQANKVADAQAELALAKKSQEQALKQRQKFQKTELALNTALEASNIAVAISNILKSAINPIFAIPLIAVMLGAFAAAKIKAFQIVNKKTFRKGGFEEIKGGSHESGKDTHVGGGNYAERNESVGIFTAKATRKYKPSLKALVRAANSGTLENILVQDRRAIQGINVVNKTDIDTSLMEKRLTRLVSLSEAKTFVDGKGRLVRIDRGRTTIINK